MPSPAAPGRTPAPGAGAGLLLPAAGDLRAITVRQPWGWSFTTSRLDPAERKDTENRSWKLPARYAGVPVALHAGQARDKAAPPAGSAAAALRGLTAGGQPADPMLTPGAVLAVITFTGCHASADCGAPAASCSPWALRGERFHWHAGPVTPLAEPVPCGGALGFWEVPGEVHAAILARLPAGTRTAPPAPRAPRPARRARRRP